MKLTNDSTYSDLRKWFTEKQDQYKTDKAALPIALDGVYMYYLNVPHTIEFYIHQIDSEFDRLGKIEIQRSAIAKSNKRNLFILYQALQDESKWNVTKDKMTKV